MVVRAVLFDLGNTLVSYYGSSGFPPILRGCLRRALSAAGLSVSALDEQRLFEHAMRLNKEREDLAVRPLADRLQELFCPYAELTNTKLADVCGAFLEPIFACAELDVAAPHVLEELRRGGVKTGIVSNTPWGVPRQPGKQSWPGMVFSTTLMRSCSASMSAGGNLTPRRFNGRWRIWRCQRARRSSSVTTPDGTCLELKELDCARSYC
jgi:hypothetical protein